MRPLFTQLIFGHIRSKFQILIVYLLNIYLPNS